jgi:hypothetical protein
MGIWGTGKAILSKGHYITERRTTHIAFVSIDLCMHSRPSRSRESSVVKRLGYGMDDRWFESRRGLGIFLFTTASRPALGLTQPPIQWVPGALSM